MSEMDVDQEVGDMGQRFKRRTLDNFQYFKAKDDLMKQAHNNARIISQLAEFVPDFILLNKSTEEFKDKVRGVVFMTDISGFTALTEAYSLRGIGGTDQLTKTLSSYMGPLAECILIAGGDIYKYAGDAFLAVWKIDDSTTTYAVIKKAADCALYIQEKLGVHETEIGIKIRVKIGIGFGEVYQVSLNAENNEYRHFVCFGPGVQAASEAEGKCVPGDVIVAPIAWEICDPDDFKYTLLEEGFSKLTDIFDFQSNLRGKQAKNIKGQTEEYIRPTLQYTALTGLARHLEESLRTYVIPPVIKKIDDELPLEYLNESRQTSVCFIKVDVSKKYTESSQFLDNMAELVRKCFKQVYNSTVITNGCLTKVIMFDKGLTYLVVFGLPGYIHDNQSANAIKFSCKIKSILHEIHEYISEVSIGVTSGTVYCGILGHRLRQEYTVIGKIVNKAARLMCYYPNRVTCDQDTLYHSKLPVHQFSLMEAKELKGIKNAGNIYEYVGFETEEEQGIKHYDYPLLNREVERKLFQNIIEAAKAECARFLKVHRMAGAEVEYSINKEVQALGYRVLVLEGDVGMGKSRLISNFIDEAEKKGVQVFSITMNLISGSQSLSAIRSLLYQALKLNDMRSSTEREEHLRQLAGSDAELFSGLCLLNDVLNVKFPIHRRYVDVDIGTRSSYARHIASILVRMAYRKSLIIFVVDDAHYMDAYSWEFLVYLSRTPTTFSVLSIRRSSNGLPKLSDPVNQYIYHNKNVKLIRLTGLDTELCLPLACQFAEVNAIPMDLERILKGKSKGNPAWIEQVLNEWLRTGLLKTLPFDLREATNRRLDMAIIERKEYIKKAKNKRIRKTFPSLDFDNVQAQRQILGTINAEDRMIVVKSDTNINSVKTLPGSLREILLDAFDELDSNQQMVVKCASVLGTKFSKAMMTQILPSYEKHNEKYELSFKKLMSSQVIQCASIPTKDLRLVKDESNIHCYCKFSQFEIEELKKVDNKMSDNVAKEKQTEKVLTFKERPAFHHCKFLKFAKDNMQEVIYELMTQDQRKEFHLQAAKYLENASGKCSVHGGEETTYAFGFTCKGNDMAADIEETLVTINSQETRHQKFIEQNNMSVRVNDRAKIRSIGLGAGNNKLTAFNKIREIYHNSGAKVGEMELDIFKELEKFEHAQHSSSLPTRILCSSCIKSKSEVEREREYDFEVLESKGRTKEEIGAEDVASALEDNPESEVDADLRGCYCVQVHTKLSEELVRHFQIAEKFGKCVMYLLDAAESATSIGEITQSFIHLEDAESLFNKIKTNEIAISSKDSEDWQINANEVQVQLDFLYGLSYFESGIQSKALEYFTKTAHSFKIRIPGDKVTTNAATARISAILWRRHHIGWLKLNTKKKTVESSRITKLRLLAYLHELYHSLFKEELALYIGLYQAKVAEESGVFDDILPAYCSVMESYSLTNDHKKSKEYERLSMKLIRNSFVSPENQNPVNLHSTSKVFITVAGIRLLRGEINSSIDAGYIALRIANLLHNNVTSSIVYPKLICSLMLSLRISEVVEALQKFWYITEEDEDWACIAKYYVLCINLFLNTAYPIEPFSTCEQFVKNSDWDADIQTFGIFEVQYDMEASIALWHLRFGRWGIGITWFQKAEKHRTKNATYVRVEADLKILECMLILVSHFLQAEHYQKFANYRDKAKAYMKYLEKGVESVPVFSPRFNHLMGYYCQIQSRKTECNVYLKKAERIALEHGNNLEIEWICHNRAVWADNAVPTIKNFWIEHTERNTLDWHQSGKIPWANIMYSLPLPAWK